eukprot:NODE_461_length_980_cov_1471.084855_g294_i0.p4 GENE.NODE_461_length_980_cov_1471.084855_g294_i0~~NODE_461_length_980_cov_1471.084855_g294_i0.p4  ORF type:complete len:91 (-),score=24.57 NODE_461_length_980_cov_1471.084855_g294_i0:628-900(-)
MPGWGMQGLGNGPEVKQADAEGQFNAEAVPEQAVHMCREQLNFTSPSVLATCNQLLTAGIDWPTVAKHRSMTYSDGAGGTTSGSGDQGFW